MTTPADVTSPRYKMLKLRFYDLIQKINNSDQREVARLYAIEGYEVRELSFNDDYHDKRGIYTELLAPGDEDAGTGQTEIVQFMFTRPWSTDVVYVARMEYPFGDTRSTIADTRAALLGK